jgi:superfamily I DNA/RNA helicase
MKINGFDENIIENPIRSHIGIRFEKVADKGEMLLRIVNDLKTNFNPDKSTVLIFVQSRKGTEEASRELNKLFEENELPFTNKVDFFHAGLYSTDRAEKYQKFKNRDIVVLVATKAFGMGMDIKDIHYVYHLGPSSSFEDYLQEIGRAGRKVDLYEEAGFSIDNPIKTKCFFTPTDFDFLRDRLHKNQITWNHLIQIKKIVFDYLEKFKPLIEDDENAFPLPLDLLDDYAEFKEVREKETFFRICLYWLEKLKRISLGVFTPTHIPITINTENHNFKSVKNQNDKLLLEKLFNRLLEFKKENFPDSEIIMIGIQELKDSIGINNNNELMSLIFMAQKCNMIIIEREIGIEPTHLRAAELFERADKFKSPLIEATFAFSNEIINNTKTADQKIFEEKDLEEIINPIINKFLNPNKFNWKEKKSDKAKKYLTQKELAENAIKDFGENRKKFGLKILNSIPKIKYKDVINFEKGYKKPVITRLIYNSSKSKEEQIEYLQDFKKDLYNLINLVSQAYAIKNESKFNIIDLMISLNIEDKGENYLQELLFMAKGLAYLKGEGNLVPLGIELFTKKTNEILEDCKDTDDAQIHEEFIDTANMKLLRLMALECLSERPYNEQDRFIRSFFKCASVKELLLLLQEYLNEDNPLLAQYRQEALEKEKEKLNSQQTTVYEVPINKNIQVIAGPGSGKTHTLILRIARLVQDEKVNPENILVLAYNRAVVIELKDRLAKLFKELGYAKLINRLKVFTFHGFAKYCLGDKINDMDFDVWTPEFIKTMNETPGLINQKLGLIKYVFVDEFQDITKDRLSLLQFIAKPKDTKICVIGDPNQSIYGYQRDQVNEPMDPKPYYEEFKKIYKPIELNLAINYRSYPEILEEAEKLLSLNTTLFEMPKLEAFLIPDSNEKYCDIEDLSKSKINWKDKVLEFVKYTDSKEDKYKQIAVMFRSNDEVYRAFNILKNEKLENVKIRIQGSKGSLFKTREFFYAITYFETKSEQLLEVDFIEKFEVIKTKIIKDYPNWEEDYLDVLSCILVEFKKDIEENATYEDLIEFIKEISYKDDGQFGKIYQQNIKKIKSNYIEQEIVLTTMHKVKGIEFDAVVIPASLSDLPKNFGNNEVPNEKIPAYMEEERRLFYVAYTRAKKRLFVLQYHREKKLIKNEVFKFPTDFVKTNYGLKINEGIDKFTMYWSASNYGGNSFEYIRDNVKIGNEIKLKKTEYNGTYFWYVYHNNKAISLLSQSMNSKLYGYDELNELVVSSVYVNTIEETLAYDEKNQKKYADKWTQEAKERGYIYLIDFSGYGKK